MQVRELCPARAHVSGQETDHLGVLTRNEGMESGLAGELLRPREEACPAGLVTLLAAGPCVDRATPRPCLLAGGSVQGVSWAR